MGLPAFSGACCKLGRGGRGTGYGSVCKARRSGLVNCPADFGRNRAAGLVGAVVNGMLLEVQNYLEDVLGVIRVYPGFASGTDNFKRRQGRK